MIIELRASIGWGDNGSEVRANNVYTKNTILYIHIFATMKYSRSESVVLIYKRRVLEIQPSDLLLQKSRY